MTIGKLRIGEQNVSLLPGQNNESEPSPKRRANAGEPSLRRENTFWQTCRAPAVRGKKRCRMHGGAPGSGAPLGNSNALKHGHHTRRRIEERRQVQNLVRQARELVRKVG